MRARKSLGFTLVEAIIVIVVVGILAGMVAVFLKAPIDAYLDIGRRAALTDAADGALRRMARDLRTALPNSVRQPAGSDQCLEFIPTKTGGRYRVSKGAAGDDELDFTTVDDRFEMLGRNSTLPAGQQIVPGDIVVVENDGSTEGDAYTGANAIQVTGLSEGTATTTLTLAAAGGLFGGKRLPMSSPAHRFQVIPANEHVVTYVCSNVGESNGTGTGVLLRYARTLTAAYPLPGTCPTPPAGTPVLVDHVSQCSLKYEGTDLARNGLISMTLTLQRDGETVSLYHQALVNNTP